MDIDGLRIGLIISTTLFCFIMNAEQSGWQKYLDYKENNPDE